MTIYYALAMEEATTWNKFHFLLLQFYYPVVKTKHKLYIFFVQMICIVANDGS